MPLETKQQRLQPQLQGMLVVHPIDGFPLTRPIAPRTRDSKIAVWLSDVAIAAQLLKMKASYGPPQENNS